MSDFYGATPEDDQESIAAVGGETPDRIAR
jgi:hypothetical protein